MSGEPWQKHVRILAFDLKGYSALKDHEKSTTQKKLHACRDGCTPEGAQKIGGNLGGDGGMIFFDGPAGCNLDAVALFREQMQAQGIAPETVRFALHDGEVIWNGEDYAGGAVDLVMDLLTGMPRLPAGLVVVSALVAYILEHQRAGMENSLIRLIDVGVKTRSHEAWAVTRSATFESAEQAQEIDGVFGPRPWCFMQEGELLDRVEVQSFLETLPRYVPAGFAARAALRVMPALMNSIEVTRKNLDAIISPTFHGTGPPWFAGTCPNLGGEVRAHSAAAAHSAARSAAARSASYAASAASYAAFGADLRGLLNAGADLSRLKQVMTGKLWPGIEPEGFSKL